MNLSRLSEYSSQPLSISRDPSDNKNRDPLPPNIKRMRKSNYIYKRVASFSDLESARQLICSTLEGLVYHGVTNNSDGDKIFYLCSTDKLCDARAYIQLLHALFIVHKTGLPHSHTEKPKRGMSHVTKEAINELLQKGVRKPQQILEGLVEMKILPPTYQQLNNYLKKYKAQIIAQPIQSYADLELTIEPFKTIPPSDDCPYVVNSYFDYQSGVARIFWSTKRLLRLKTCDYVSIDATHKLVWQNWSVIITGTINKAARFHPFCFCLVADETSIDYEFERAAVCCQKTNNQIETTNQRHVKERATFRRNLPFPEFIAMVNKLVQNWSIKQH